MRWCGATSDSPNILRLRREGHGEGKEYRERVVTTCGLRSVCIGVASIWRALQRECAPEFGGHF